MPTPPSLSSEQSALKVRFERLFLPNRAAIQALVYAAVRDRITADDIFQDVAAALWKGFATYDPERPFMPWARGVASNILKVHYDKRARGVTILAPEVVDALVDSAQQESDAFASGEAETALRQCLQKVPQRARRILSLRYEGELELQLIAMQVGVGVEGIRKALARLRRALKSCIERRVANTTSV